MRAVWTSFANTAGRLGTLALAVPFLVACGGDPENGGVRVSEAGEVSAERPAPAPAGGPTSPQLPRLPHFQPAAGPVGSEVEVWMDGLPREAEMYIGFGTVQEHTIVTGEETDAEGTLRTRVTIPSSARVNRSHYFFVADASQLPLSVSQAFLVTDADGFAEVRGDVVEMAGSCAILMGLEEERYALEGDLSGLSVGERVTVRGQVLLDGGACDGGLAMAVERTDREE
jgi:hypothetical protein